MVTHVLPLVVHNRTTDGKGLLRPGCPSCDPNKKN